MATANRLAQHTPGPWNCYIGDHADPGFHVYRTDGHGNGDHVACIPEDPESDANARLMAAAPELLEALGKLKNEAIGFLAMSDPQTHGHTNRAVLRDRIMRAENALAKAEGRS